MLVKEYMKENAQIRIYDDFCSKEENKQETKQIIISLLINKLCNKREDEEF